VSGPDGDLTATTSAGSDVLLQSTSLRGDIAATIHPSLSEPELFDYDEFGVSLDGQDRPAGIGRFLQTDPGRAIVSAETSSGAVSIRRGAAPRSTRSPWFADPVGVIIGVRACSGASGRAGQQDGFAGAGVNAVVGLHRLVQG
jgi:hypothetical protein